MGSPEPTVAAPCAWAGAEAAVSLEGSSKTQLLFRPPGARCGVWHHTPWWHCENPAFDLMAVTSLLPFCLCPFVWLNTPVWPLTVQPLIVQCTAVHYHPTQVSSVSACQSICQALIKS